MSRERKLELTIAVSTEGDISSITLHQTRGNEPAWQPRIEIPFKIGLKQGDRAILYNINYTGNESLIDPRNYSEIEFFRKAGGFILGLKSRDIQLLSIAKGYH